MGLTVARGWGWGGGGLLRRSCKMGNSVGAGPRPNGKTSEQRRKKGKAEVKWRRQFQHFKPNQPAESGIPHSSKKICTPPLQPSMLLLGGPQMVRLQCPHLALAAPAPQLSSPSVQSANVRRSLSSRSVQQFIPRPCVRSLHSLLGGGGGRVCMHQKYTEMYIIT